MPVLPQYTTIKNWVAKVKRRMSDLPDLSMASTENVDFLHGMISEYAYRKATGNVNTVVLKIPHILWIAYFLIAMERTCGLDI